MTLSNQWDSIRLAIDTGEAPEVLALSCPACGSALKVWFFPGDPAIEFPTRLQYAAINIDCTECSWRVRRDGGDVNAPWVAELGSYFTTQPSNT